MKSFVSPVYLFVFVAARVVEGENGNLQSDQFPLVFTVTMFFSSCRLMRFFLFFCLFFVVFVPSGFVTSPSFEIIHSLSLLHLSLSHTLSNMFK